jgi:subtilisin family serine protease
VAGLRRDVALNRLRATLGLPGNSRIEEPPVSRLLREKKRAGAAVGPPSEESMDWDRFHFVKLAAGMTAEAALALLKDHPLLEYAELDGVGSGGDILPNDPGMASQWHHRNMVFPGADIATPRAWDLATGSSQVIVAVLDSGLAPGLPEFAGREVAGYDFVNDDSDPADDHGHGTAVTGTIAANANNAFLGAGVDWSCRVMPVKVLDASNRGLYSRWAQGLDWAVSQGGHLDDKLRRAGRGRL